MLYSDNEIGYLDARVGLTRRRVLVGAAVGVLAGIVHAQTAFPTQPIKAIVPWPPGGGVDVIARTIAPGMSKALGQPIVIENRPGAGGRIGHGLAARAPADGYTILFSSTDTHAVAQQLFRDASFSPKDFVGVASLGSHPLGLAVQPTSKAVKLADFIAMAKASPEPITYGTYGLGSSAHVMMEEFASRAKIRVLHVPFQGSAPMFQALLGGQIAAGFSQVVSMDSFVKAGSLRMLAVTNRERLPSHPNVATFGEQGFPLDVGSWLGILAPAQTPTAATVRIQEAVHAALQDPATMDKILSFGTVMDTMNRQAFDAFVRSEYERWGSYIRNNNIKVDN